MDVEFRVCARPQSMFKPNRCNKFRVDHHDYPQTVIIQRNENIQSLKKVSESFGILPMINLE